MLDIFNRTVQQMDNVPPLPLTNQMTCDQQYNTSLEIAMTAYHNNIITDMNGLYSVSALQQFILGYPVFIENPHPQPPPAFFQGYSMDYQIPKPVPNDYNMLGVIFTSYFVTGSPYFQRNGCIHYPISDLPHTAFYKEQMEFPYSSYGATPGVTISPQTPYDHRVTQDFFYGDCAFYVNYLNSGKLINQTAVNRSPPYNSITWTQHINDTYNVTDGLIPISVCVSDAPVIRGITQRNSRGDIGSEHDRLQSLSTTSKQRGGQVTNIVANLT